MERTLSQWFGSLLDFLLTLFHERTRKRSASLKLNQSFSQLAKEGCSGRILSKFGFEENPNLERISQGILLKIVKSQPGIQSGFRELTPFQGFRKSEGCINHDFYQRIYRGGVTE
jgi:hypothetical protein